MRFFAAFVLIAAVASAEPTKAPSAAAIIAQILEAIAALKPEPIAVGPAIVDTEPIAIGPEIIENPLEGISVGPAIIENPLEGIAVGPAMIDFPLPDGGAVTAPVVNPSPVAIVEGPAPDVSASAPLVQIILNINQAAQSSPVAVAPVVVPEPVQVVDAGPKPIGRPTPIATVPVVAEPVQVVEEAPAPIVRPIPVPTLPIVEAVPEPVHVVDTAPAPAEPVLIGIPVIPEPAVIIPEQLN